MCKLLQINNQSFTFQLKCDKIYKSIYMIINTFTVNFKLLFKKSTLYIICFT